MSDIRFNTWLHQSGTGGITQVDGGHVGIGTTNPDIAVHTANAKKVNVGIVTANSIYAGNFYGNGSNLTGVGHVDKIIEGDTKVEVFDAGSQYISAEVNGSEKVRIDSSGRVLIGTTTVGQVSGDDLTIETSGSTGITLRSDGGYAGNILFSDGTSGDDQQRGILQYHHSDNTMRFFTNAARRMTITSSGSVMINKTSSFGSVPLQVKGASSGLSDGGQIFDIGTAEGSSGTRLAFGVNEDNFVWIRGYESGVGGRDIVFGASDEKMRITSTGQVNIGTSGVLKAEINNSVNGHYFVSQCSDNNDGFEIYQQHGSTASRNTLAVYDNRRGSKIESLLIRGDGVMVTRSRGGNYARTYEFNYNDGAPGGQQTKSLATISTYNDVTSAVAEVVYVGVYGTANHYIYTSKWVCGVRRQNSNTGWNQTAAESNANGNQSEASLDIYWSNGQLYAQTVGPWMGWTVNVRVTLLNGELTVNV